MPTFSRISQRRSWLRADDDIDVTATDASTYMFLYKLGA